MQKDIDVLAKEAARDLSSKDYVSAVNKYERLASLQPNSANILNNLGIAYHGAGRLQEAAATFQKALRLNPDLLSALLFLGIEYIQLGQPEKALPLLEKAASKDASSRDVLLALASAQFGLKRFDGAARTYQREIKLRPEDSDAWYGFGFCFENLAELTTRRMVNVGADSPFTHMLTGEFLTEQGASLDAEEAFRRAQAAGGEQEGLHAALGFAHLRFGELSRAEQEFRAETERYPGNLEGKLGLAALAMEKNDFGEATRGLCAIQAQDEGYFNDRLSFFLASLREQTQTKALENLLPQKSTGQCAATLELITKELTAPESALHLDYAFETLEALSRKASSLESAGAPADYEAGRYSTCADKMLAAPPKTIAERLLLARCGSRSGRFFAAFEASQSVLEKEPQNMAAHYWQVQSARKLAQAAFQRAINLRPDSWQGHLLLGDIYRQRKKWDLSMSHYESAARLKLDNPGALMGIATIYWQTGRNSEGESAIRKALRIVPENPLANYILGDILVRQRRFDEAIPYLQKHISYGQGLLTAHGDLGRAYAALGRDPEAISELELALPSDRSGELHFQLSKLYRKQGRSDLANQALAKSEALRDHNRETQRERLDRAVISNEKANPP